jgi:hypothetical protein
MINNNTRTYNIKKTVFYIKKITENLNLINTVHKRIMKILIIYSFKKKTNIFYKSNLVSLLTNVN